MYNTKGIGIARRKTFAEPCHSCTVPRLLDNLSSVLEPQRQETSTTRPRRKPMLAKFLHCLQGARYSSSMRMNHFHRTCERFRFRAFTIRHFQSRPLLPLRRIRPSLVLLRNFLLATKEITMSGMRAQPLKPSPCQATAEPRPDQGFLASVVSPTGQRRGGC